MIGLILFIYLCYIIISFLFLLFCCIFVIDDEDAGDIDEKCSPTKFILLGCLYYIPKLIIVNKNINKARKDKEIKREFENEIDEIKQKLKVLDIVMLRIFYDILVGVNCGEYTDLQEKEKRLRTQCLNIMFRINKEENIEDFKEEINIALTETKKGLIDIKKEAQQRNKVANRINNKITKEKLNEDMKELKQMIEDNKEYIKYGEDEK